MSLWQIQLLLGLILNMTLNETQFFGNLMLIIECGSNLIPIEGGVSKSYTSFWLSLLLVRLQLLILFLWPCTSYYDRTLKVGLHVHVLFKCQLVESPLVTKCPFKKCTYESWIPITSKKIVSFWFRFILSAILSIDFLKSKRTDGSSKSSSWPFPHSWSRMSSWHPAHQSAPGWTKNTSSGWVGSWITKCDRPIYLSTEITHVESPKKSLSGWPNNLLC